MLLDMSCMRLSRCLANSSSGQCRSLMKVWRASSFQKRSSDVPEPLLPSTHTHTHRSEDKGHPDEEREGGRGVFGGRGCVVAGVEEEDAVPPHLDTVRFYSDHTLTAMSQCLSHSLFVRMCLDSQCMDAKEQAGF